MARTPPARTVGQRPLIAVVALVVLAIATPAVLDEQANRDPAGQQGPGSQAAPDPSPEPGRSAQVVGPVRGADVQGYVEDRTTALLESPATVDTAVVSFSDVLSARDALAVIGDAGNVRVLLYQLPLEQASPRSVRVGADEDPVAALEASLQEQVPALQEERESAVELLESDTVEDEDFVADYERRVAELDQALAAAEDGRVVHAVVVRAPLEQLQDLVDATAVRLVDPAPPETDLGGSVFHGLLPSDTGTVSQGRAA